jgi:hypothetical protein
MISRVMRLPMPDGTPWYVVTYEADHYKTHNNSSSIYKPTL